MILSGIGVEVIKNTVFVDFKLSFFLRGTEGRNRTDTPVKEPDFESGASTSSATPAR